MTSTLPANPNFCLFQFASHRFRPRSFPLNSTRVSNELSLPHAIVQSFLPEIYRSVRTSLFCIRNQGFKDATKRHPGPPYSAEANCHAGRCTPLSDSRFPQKRDWRLCDRSRNPATVPPFCNQRSLSLLALSLRSHPELIWTDS